MRLGWQKRYAYRSSAVVIPDLNFCSPCEQLGLRKGSFTVCVLLTTHTRVDRDPKAWIEDEDEARRVSQTPLFVADIEMDHQRRRAFYEIWTMDTWVVCIQFLNNP